MATKRKAPAPRYVRPQMKTAPTLRAIPRPVATTVGRVMILSGLVEYHLLLVAKRLAGVGIKQARITFGTPRWGEYADRIQNLAELGAFDLRTNMSALQNRLDSAERRRNLLAHSAWMKDGPRIVVQYTRGRYDAPRGQGKSHRTLYPESIHVTPEFRRESVRMLAGCLRDLKRLAKVTDRLLKSRDEPMPASSRRGRARKAA